MKPWLIKSLFILTALVIGTGSASAQKVSLGYQPIVGPLLNVIAEKNLKKKQAIKLNGSNLRQEVMLLEH